jgi:biotin carboxyl carrier protein
MSDDAASADPSDAASTAADQAEGARAIGKVADQLLPALIARLAASDLGELEVAEKGWRIRLRRDLTVPRESDRTSASPSAHTGGHTPIHSGGHTGGQSGSSSRGAGGSHDQSGAGGGAGGPGAGGSGGSGANLANRSSVVRRAAVSPGVGYFTPRDGLATGQAVRSGDVLGAIDVLGVAQQVIAPSDGVVGRILASTGEAVEYGQELVRIDGIERLAES